jgi:general secretion pathway protein E
MTQELRLPFSYAKRYGVFINKMDEQSAEIVYRPELETEVIVELRRFLQRPLKLREVAAEHFDDLLAKAYEANSNSAAASIVDLEEDFNLADLVHSLPKTEDLLESEDDAPIIKLINAILTQAIKQAASDIHLETFEQRLIVRYRIDGVLQIVLEPPRVLAPLLISRIKVMAKLDIAEKRLPQDGRITLRVAGRAIDIRVSTLPSNHGERVVLRLLDKQAARLDLQHLGMPLLTMQRMDQLIHRPHGIILVTGPTGSGKTTTLYAALSQLNDKSRNILTVEDPIEYELPGIGQTQVNTKINMTFARGLRAILRQDPDVVMVGEIRDVETAEIAVQASLTGHLVLSTLHTNSAVGAITRLQDMGVKSFLLASTVIGVAAQRLARVLCTHCKQAYTASTSECELLGVKSATLYQATGCSHCSNTGYRGRRGVYELIMIDESVRNLIHDNAAEAVIEKAVRQHYPSLRQEAYQLVLTGVTSIEEIIRITSEN